MGVQLLRDRAPLLAPIAWYKRLTISIQLTKIMSKTIHINCYFNFFSHLNNISSLFYLISISFATSISSTLTNNQCPVPRPMHATHFYNFYTYNNYYYHQYEDLVYACNMLYSGWHQITYMSKCLLFTIFWKIGKFWYVDK